MDMRNAQILVVGGCGRNHPPSLLAVFRCAARLMDRSDSGQAPNWSWRKLQPGATGTG